MPGSKLLFFSAWLLIVVVGAYVNFNDPEPDWTGYCGAMLLIPLAFFFMGVVSACFKIALLIPYLLLRSIFDFGVLKRWWKFYGNWESFKDLFVLKDFSCFYIPSKEDIAMLEKGKQRHGKNYRTKEEYERLKKEGKLP